MTGCAGDDLPTGPDLRRAAPGDATVRWTIDEFVEAQGTFCGATGIYCLPELDIGSVTGSAESPDGPFVLLDVGGVNARWFAEHLGRDLGYAYSGTVKERRLADGRRLVTVNLRFENTLVTVYAGSPEPIFGADLFEYGTVEPELGSGNMMLRFILPADYVGLPDLVELFFEPQPEMETLQFVANLRSEGTLRSAFDGIPAGARVRVTLHTDWLPKLIGTPAEHGKGLLRTFFDPGVRLDIRAVR